MEFLDYVYIPDPPPEGKGSVNFTKPDHILRLHEACESLPAGESLPLIKARKLYVTSYFCGRALWVAQYQPSAFYPITSQGEDEAKEFIRTTRFIWENLPDYLRVPLRKGEDNTETLGFAGGGRIQAFPSTEKAGRSYLGATEGLIDEADFHPYFATTYETQMPLIESAGGKLFVVSTPNYKLVDSDFRRLFQQSTNQLYLGYFDRPGRTQATYNHAKSQALDLARFEKENNRTLEEALAPPRASAYFDPDMLQYMLANDVLDGREVGNLSIWKEPGVGRRYVLGADPAWGKTGSFTVASVEEWGVYEQVAQLRGRLHPNEAAYEIMELHKKYNHAYMGIERAGEGQERDGDAVVVVDKIVTLLGNCSCDGRLFYNDHLSTNPKVPGWVTDGRSRTPMLGLYRETVREGHSIIRSRVGVSEMMTFIQNESGRPEAAKGAYDDCVMCYAITRKMHEYAAFMGQIRTAVMPSFA